MKVGEGDSSNVISGGVFRVPCVCATRDLTLAAAPKCSYS